MYRVGILGTGRIASTLEDEIGIPAFSITGAFQALPQTEVVAACNRGEERLRQFGRRWGVGALYRDFREMLEKESLDIVAVATPPAVHPEMVIAAAEAGVRGILCEKPMALSVGECDAMIEACEMRGTKLAVNFSNRWRGEIEAARQLASSGQLGPLLHIKACSYGCKPTPEWEAETEGPMLHDAIHMLDMMRFFAGDPTAVLGRAIRQKRKELRVEDTAYALIQFRSGVDGVLICDELTEFNRIEIELTFKEGIIRMGSGLGEGVWKSEPSPVEKGWWYQLVRAEMPASPWTEVHQVRAVRELVECIEHDRESRSSGYDGRAAVEIIMAIYESQRLGNLWTELPLTRKERMIDVLREEGIF